MCPQPNRPARLRRVDAAASDTGARTSQYRRTRRRRRSRTGGRSCLWSPIWAGSPMLGVVAALGPIADWGVPDVDPGDQRRAHGDEIAVFLVTLATFSGSVCDLLLALMRQAQARRHRVRAAHGDDTSLPTSGRWARTGSLRCQVGGGISWYRATAARPQAARLLSGRLGRG